MALSRPMDSNYTIVVGLPLLMQHHADAQAALPPILLLHGLASAARIWDFVAPLLAEHGYVVTALDQRGHGESEKPGRWLRFCHHHRR